MNTTDIYKIKQNGDVQFYVSLPNDYVGATYVWEPLSKKYNTKDTISTGYENLIDMYKHNHTKMKTYERITLGTTLDCVCMLKKDFNQIIDAFTKFDQHYPNSNLPLQIEVIKTLQKDDDCIGITWEQNSVRDMRNYDNKSDFIPYNIFKGEKHVIVKL